MKYLLIDTANTFFRARHIASRGATAEEKVGMALHLTLSSVQQVVRKYGCEDTHVVFCLEGRSWRKDYYEPYKRNRSDKRAAHTEQEAAEDRMFWDTFDEFCDFLRNKTNVSVLRHEAAEADDLIARFIHLHPDDEHYIISSDGDYEQLLTEQVKQYNGVTGHLITVDGIFDDKGRAVIDKKTNMPKVVGDVRFNLFEKCMRGDSGDNVFSAYPGVRTKGSSKKVGLIEAYADRESKGFAWNNMMLQRWTDHEGTEHRVLDDYLRNVTLIDLTAQPEAVKEYVDATIRNDVRRTMTSQVGIHFMRFCGKHELVKISEQAESYARWINRPYTGVLKDIKDTV
jgi:5'-3' exonuclease